MTVGTIKKLIAAYLKVTTAECIIDGVDLLLTAMNSARRQAEDIVDFHFSEAIATLSVASTGGSLDAVTINSTPNLSLKRISTVSLPASSGDPIPIEFITNDQWNLRVRALIGRQPYAAGISNLGDYGFDQSWPTAFQHGRLLFLVPASQFTYPVTVTLDGIRFQADYTADGNTDPFTTHGSDYLIWGSILEVNKKWKEFLPRQEGNLDETSLQERRDSALASLMEWDRSIKDGTTAPQPKPKPVSQSQPKQTNQ